MKVLLQDRRLILVPECGDEEAALADWRRAHDNFVFATAVNAGTGATLVGLGHRDEACREPINVTSMSPEPVYWISNFAPAPFELDGALYSCVEAFWQSLRFPQEERARIANLDGAQAKRESERQPYGATVIHGGRVIAVGTFDHWQLMVRACHAKFEQNARSREALLGTGDRPLAHIVRRDSRTIPGVIMADIWMKVRRALRCKTGLPS
jgi:predicted NAD-dependent protein-ADP-ribosyltransferase YbiA (DUF1768 family)